MYSYLQTTIKPVARCRIRRFTQHPNPVYIFFYFGKLIQSNTISKWEVVGLLYSYKFSVRLKSNCILLVCMYTIWKTNNFRSYFFAICSNHILCTYDINFRLRLKSNCILLVCMYTIWKTNNFRSYFFAICSNHILCTYDINFRLHSNCMETICKYS
jgi:hypothetical protein